VAGLDPNILHELKANPLSFEDFDQHMGYATGLHDYLQNAQAIDADGVLDVGKTQQALQDLDQKDFLKWKNRMETGYLPVMAHLQQFLDKPAASHIGYLSNLGGLITSASGDIAHDFAYEMSPQGDLRIKDPKQTFRAVTSSNTIHISPENVNTAKKALQYAQDARRLLQLSNKVVKIANMRPGRASTPVGVMMGQNAAGMAALTHAPGQIKSSMAKSDVKTSLYLLNEILDIDQNRAWELAKNIQGSKKDITTFTPQDTKNLRKAIIFTWHIKKGMDFTKAYLNAQDIPIDYNLFNKKRGEYSRYNVEPAMTSIAEEIVNQPADSEFIDVLLLRLALDNYVEDRHAHRSNS
jgi:hypothetical protein